MSGKTAAFLIVLLVGMGAASAQSRSTAGNFENQYVKMTILPGWTVDASSSPPLVKLTHGKYVLTIDPILVHATAFGSLETIARQLPSVEAVMASVDEPWSTTCAQSVNTIMTGKIQLWPLYTDATKTNADYGCKFPSDRKSAWFGSAFLGEGTESEYIIALAYDTRDVNALPKKGTPELTQVLSDADTMMKTLDLKPPIVISSIEPQVAPPGAKVTIHGSGFGLQNFNLRPQFTTLPDLPLEATVAPNGNSMTFEIPASINIISCDRPGYVDINENCVPAPAQQHYVECPPVNDRHPTYCGIQFLPGTYQVQVIGNLVHSNTVALTVTAAAPIPVSISLLYPNSGVLAGDTIRVSGTGFTKTGNTVKIGNVVVSNIPSPDGTSLSFEAPQQSASCLTSHHCEARIANANGESNPIVFGYVWQF